MAIVVYDHSVRAGKIEIRAPEARKRERCAGRRSRPASSRDERPANPKQRGRASRLAQPMVMGGLYAPQRLPQN